MVKDYVNVNNLKVSSILYKFVNEELLKDTNITAEKFWLGFDKSVHELAPKNTELLKKREDLQNKINKWHIQNKGKNIQIDEYKKFLKEIGYLVNEGPDFKIETTSELNISEINIYNTQGIRMLHLTNVRDKINISNLQSGIYILEAYTNKLVYKLKLVKQ